MATELAYHRARIYIEVGPGPNCMVCPSLTRNTRGKIDRVYCYIHYGSLLSYLFLPKISDASNTPGTVLGIQGRERK